MSKAATVGPGQLDPPQSGVAADPADGEFTFALSVSSIAFALPADAAELKDAPQHPPAARGRGGTKENGKAVKPAEAVADSAGPVAAGQPNAGPGNLNSPQPGTPPCDAPDNPGVDTSAHPWAACWNKLQPVVAPHPDLDYVYAGRTGQGLKLTVTPGKSPLTIATLGSNWANPTSAAITRVGGEAAAGWGLAGPYGALTVVIIGEAANTAGEGNGATPYSAKVGKGQITHFVPEPTWGDLVKAEYLCEPKDGSLDPTKQGTDAKLLLPVALDLDKSLPQDSKDPRCWHWFPKGDVSYTNQGWFYRLVERPTVSDPVKRVPPVYQYGIDDGTLNAQGIFRADGPQKLPADGKTAYFPVSACHSMQLQIVWWKDAVDSLSYPQFKERKGVAYAVTYDVTLADPHYIQKMRLTKGSRTINVGDCGATATGIAQTNVVADDFQTALKEVQDIRTAQQNWDKSKAKSQAK